MGYIKAKLELLAHCGYVFITGAEVGTRFVGVSVCMLYPTQKIDSPLHNLLRLAVYIKISLETMLSFNNAITADKLSTCNKFLSFHESTLEQLNKT